jgi:hypothetical protein
MFKVVTPGYSEAFERWTDALNAANALKPKCKSWFQDIRILDGESLVWVYSRLHRYPQYIGAGTYDRLARLFIFEAMLEAELAAEHLVKPAEDSEPAEQQLELNLELDQENDQANSQAN